MVTNFDLPYSKYPNCCHAAERLPLTFNKIFFSKKPFLHFDSYLIHFNPMFHFYTPWKRQKTKGFLRFSGGIEMELGLKHELNFNLRYQKVTGISCSKGLLKNLFRAKFSSDKIFFNKPKIQLFSPPKLCSVRDCPQRFSDYFKRNRS